jgi:SPP1 family predicted phage head-tail adaptor
MSTAGERDRRISIEQRSVATDAHGGEVETWTELKHAWAKISYGTGAERRGASQERASVPATFRILQNAATRGLTAGGHRIRFGGEIWDITSVVPFGRKDMDITATRSAA